MIKAIVYVVLVVFISKILRYILLKSLSFSKKGKTAGHMLDNLLRYVSGFLMIIIVLIVFGVDTTALFASIGILGLLIGLGAQSLISDVLSGLFIVFEGDYQIGDVIVIDGFRGSVEAIGIRTTKIKDLSGNIKIVSNSHIQSLVNMTFDLSIAVVDVEITYDESIPRVENIIREALPHIQKHIPSVVEGPFYRGVSSFNASGVALKFIARTHENDRFQAERDLRRELKLLFDQHHIDIPFQTITISNFVEANKQDITNAQKRKAQAFVEKQKEISKDIIPED